MMWPCDYVILRWSWRGYSKEQLWHDSDYVEEIIVRRRLCAKFSTSVINTHIFAVNQVSVLSAF